MSKWVLLRKGADYKVLSKELKVDPLIVRLMLNRGISDIEEMKKYLYGGLEYMHEASLLKDIKKACQLVVDKCKQKSRIRIIGDYDVDGVCASAILYKGLKLAGAVIDVDIPHRIIDGYGLNINIIKKAVSDRIDTIITCDNGISAIEAINFAKEQGLTVIVTDHHEVAFEEDETTGRKQYLIPAADAVVNPKQEDCKYPYKDICGGMVAFKCMQMLFSEEFVNQLALNETQIRQWANLEQELIQFAAIATIEDVMPLFDENRIIVKRGLELLQENSSIGLNALRTACDLQENKISAYHIGFILGPCINAAGRLDSAKRALDLLLAEDPNEAMQIALELTDLNESRKSLTDEGVEKAIYQIETNGYMNDKIMVIYIEACHESIAGIVAGRIREKYQRPAIVLTDAKDNEDGKSYVKGSARSVPAVHIYELLTKVKALLKKFGGHAQAAGLSLEKENIDELRMQLNANCNIEIKDMEETLHIDADPPFFYCTENLQKQLEFIEPTGSGNPKPIFARSGIILKRVNIYGKNNMVGKYKVLDHDDDGKLIESEITYFRKNDEFKNFLINKYGIEKINALYDGTYQGNDIKITITYYPNLNVYKGNKEMQYIMTEYC